MVKIKKSSRLGELAIGIPLLMLFSGMTSYDKPDSVKCRINNLNLGFRDVMEYTRCANGWQSVKAYNGNILDIEFIDLNGDGLTDIVLSNLENKLKRLTRDRDYEAARMPFDSGDRIIKTLMNRYPLETKF